MNRKEVGLPRSGNRGDDLIRGAEASDDGEGEIARPDVDVEEECVTDIPLFSKEAGDESIHEVLVQRFVDGQQTVFGSDDGRIEEAWLRKCQPFHADATAGDWPDE